jgi:hypothetical protein
MSLRSCIGFASLVSICWAAVACSDDVSSPRDGGPIDAATDISADTSVADASKPDRTVGDAGSDLTRDASADLPPNPNLLRNTPRPCRLDTLVHAEPNEAGQWAAVRLTPARYPFTIETIRYTLESPDQTNQLCSTGLAHRVEYYKATSVSPPATPTVIGGHDMSARAPSSSPRVISVKPTPAILLNQGEHLFVQLKMVRVGNQALCLQACLPEQLIADRDYWSGAKTAPFNWQTLSTFGIDDSFTIEAEGK